MRIFSGGRGRCLIFSQNKLGMRFESWGSTVACTKTEGPFKREALNVAFLAFLEIVILVGFAMNLRDGSYGWAGFFFGLFLKSVIDNRKGGCKCSENSR